MVDVELKDGYNKTTLGLIPNEWKLKQIGDVMEFQGGAQPPKEKFINDPKEGYIRLIQIRDYKTERYKTYIPKEMARKFCAKDDIMIGRYGPPIFQILCGLEGAYNVALLKAIPNEQVLNKEYARFFLSTEKLFKLIDRLSQRTSGQTGVDMEALNNYLIPIPTLKEQEKIVEILSTVDSQIDDTDKLIERTKELKNGLMQSLLTKGIGQKEFKESEVGKIPVEWEVRTINDLTSFVGSGITPKGGQKVYDNSGITFIRSQNVLINKISKEDIVYINDEINKKMIRTEVSSGDILLNITGASIGRCAIVPEEFGKANVNQHVCIIRIVDGCNRYLVQLMNSSFIKNQIDSFNGGSSREGLNFQQVRKLKVIFPPIEEQEKIANILSAIDNEIEEYKNKKNKLEELKKGLMQQLLTGKIRVK
jgi:type I restriction enzyme S subunit